MRTNFVRQRLKDGHTSLGCFLGLGSPSVAELLANAEFDWLVIETEHNSPDWTDVEHTMRAIDAAGTGTVPLVRVPSSDPVAIQKALDIGAYGIVVPMVRSASEAEAVVRMTRYPPHGTRSFGPFRASGYTFQGADYFASINENVLIVLIIETQGALSELEAICAIPGIDVLYIGRADLSLSMGSDPFREPNSEVDEVINRILEVGRRTGISIGSGSTTVGGLANLVEAGYRFLGLGPDYWLLIETARAGRKAIFRD